MTIDITCPICNSPAHYDFSGRDLMFDHHKRYDYFNCIECGSVFQHPMPSPKEINSFYPADYSVFDQKSQRRKLSALKRALLWKNREYAHLEPSSKYKFLAAILSPFYKNDKPNYISEGTLLDVGCGNGRYLLTMQSLGWNVQGVELSENGLKVCHDAGLTVHHGDLLSAGLPANSFDVITARHVIEHIREPHPFMAELSRILKPGGKLIIETPNSDALGRTYLGANWYDNDVPRHLILFTSQSLIKLAKQYGLENSSLRLSTSPKILLNSIDYATRNKDKPSKRIKWKRFLSRLYIWIAQSKKRGDIIHSVFTK